METQTIQFDNGRAEVFSTHAWVYAVGDHPAVGYRTAEKRWHPFKAEIDPVTHRQVANLSAEEAAARCGATASLIRQIEVAAAALYAAGQEAVERRLEDGRRAWASMTAEERQAMNDYAMKTEGHTID